ncbi:MAG: alpha/beta hydrolase, partial [Actinomycetota bacterium]|nr:alpha/beta hydrolase [Actinomycetota bacterium]
MTRSLPVQVQSAVPAAPPSHAEVDRPGRARLAVLNASSGVVLRLLPHLPDAVKRLLLGRRTVTIDGNTLDTTLQFMLAAQHS